MFEFRGTDPHTIVTGESKYAPVGECYSEARNLKYGKKKTLKMDY